MPERRPRPLRPRRPRRDRRAARGEAVRHGAPGADPRAHADPPGELSYGDLLISTFTPLRLPLTWPQFAADLEAAVDGDASNLETAARPLQTPEGFADVHDVGGDLVRRRSRPPARPRAWPEVIDRFTDVEQALGTGDWDGGCGRRARRTGRPRSTDRYTGPWNATTKTPILLINTRYDPATGYRNAQVAEQRLGNAVLLTVDGYGHPSYQVPSTCIDQAQGRATSSTSSPRREGTVCQPDQLPFP